MIIRRDWNEMMNNFSHAFGCTKCGECCTVYCIPVTHHDLHRMLKHLKVEVNADNLANIVEFIEPDDEVLETYEDVPKVTLSDYSNENLVMVLKGDDMCEFYDGNGCSIYPVRPLICRFFPFTYEFEDDDGDYSNPESKKVIFDLNEDTEYCKGKTRGKKFNFKALIKEVYETTREDVGFEEVVKKWNESIKNGEREEYDEMSFFDHIANLKI